MPKVTNRNKAGSKKFSQMADDVEDDFTFEMPKVDEGLQEAVMQAAGFDMEDDEEEVVTTKPVSSLEVTGQAHRLPKKKAVEAPAATLEPGQKKMSKKEKMQLKKEQLRSKLSFPGEKQKKTKVDPFANLSDALNEALPKSTAGPKNKQFVLNNKTKKELDADREKFELVINHPTYRANPLAVLREHLQNEVNMQNREFELNKKDSKKKRK